MRFVLTFSLFALLACPSDPADNGGSGQDGAVTGLKLQPALSGVTVQRSP